MDLLRGFGLLVILGLVSCHSLRSDGPHPLLVGTSANYAPMLWQQEGRMMGAEADLLHMLAARLNRPLQFVLLSEDERVGALMTGEVDLLAGGLTVKEAERWRIGFTEPFLQSGQMALCRREDYGALASMRRLRKGGLTIGIRKGGTAERVLPVLFPRMQLKEFPDAGSGAAGLENDREISLFVDDAPIVWNLVSQDGRKLLMLPFSFSTDLYVWGVRPDNSELRAQIDDLLLQWRRSGTLHAVLKKWLPVSGR